MARKLKWDEAISKVIEEGQCRVCGSGRDLDPAHLWPRGRGGSMHVENIVPLCRGCHSAFDASRLDVLAVLSDVEQARLVVEAGGIESARRRVLPSEYR